MAVRAFRHSETLRDLLGPSVQVRLMWEVRDDEGEEEEENEGTEREEEGQKTTVDQKVT